MVKLLIRSGANPVMQLSERIVPIAVAFERMNLDIIRIWVETGRVDLRGQKHLFAGICSSTAVQYYLSTIPDDKIKTLGGIENPLSNAIGMAISNIPHKEVAAWPHKTSLN